MKNLTRPTTSLATAPATLTDDALAPASGAGLYKEVQNFLYGLMDGYKDHDKDQDIHYGGPDGLAPPNA